MTMTGFDAAGKFSGFFPGFEPTPATTADNTGGMSSGRGGNLSDQYKSYLDRGIDSNTALKLIELENEGKDDLSMRELLEFGFDPERQGKLLALKNEFEAERMAQAAPYNLMYQLPKTIMQGAMLPATIALGGSNRVAEGLARMGGIQTVGASPNPGSRYFGSFG
jgi:hypothetical protein